MVEYEIVGEKKSIKAKARLTFKLDMEGCPCVYLVDGEREVPIVYFTQGGRLGLNHLVMENANSLIKAGIKMDGANVDVE